MTGQCSITYLPSESLKTLKVSISPSNEYLGLISFRIDWCDLLADQGLLGPEAKCCPYNRQQSESFYSSSLCGTRRKG